MKLFKTLVVRRFYNLSDEQTEHQVSDRLSFQRFIGWTPADKAPDANTLRDFREALILVGVFEQLFDLFEQRLQERGLLAQPGKLVDASFVDVPRQRNTREENAAIEGEGDAGGAGGPARQTTAKGCGGVLDQEERGSALRLREPRQGRRPEQTQRAVCGD